MRQFTGYACIHSYIYIKYIYIYMSHMSIYTYIQTYIYIYIALKVSERPNMLCPKKWYTHK